MTYVISQVLVVISAVFYIASLQFNTKSKLLLIQSFSTTLFASHLLLLQSYTVAFLIFADLARTITFYFIEKYNNSKKLRITYSGIFFVVGLVIAILTWQNWYSIFSLVAYLTVSIFLAISKLIPLKFAYVFAVTCNTIYLFFVKSYFGIIVQLIIITFGISTLVIDLLKKQKIKNN